MRGAGGQVERRWRFLRQSCSHISVPRNLGQNGVSLEFGVLFGSKSSQAGRGLQLFECRRPPPCSAAAPTGRPRSPLPATLSESMETSQKKIDLGMFSVWLWNAASFFFFFVKFETFSKRRGAVKPRLKEDGLKGTCDEHEVRVGSCVHWKAICRCVCACVYTVCVCVWFVTSSERNMLGWVVLKGL